MGRHDRFLALAAAEATNSSQETKHGSLLVRAGKVIGSGCNSDRSRLASLPGTERTMISLHSEVRATPQPETAHPLFFFPPPNRAAALAINPCCLIPLSPASPSARTAGGAPRGGGRSVGFTRLTITSVRARS